MIEKDITRNRYQRARRGPSIQVLRSLNISALSFESNSCEKKQEDGERMKERAMVK
jgi:hypothetical protein